MNEKKVRPPSSYRAADSPLSNARVLRGSAIMPVLGGCRLATCVTTKRDWHIQVGPFRDDKLLNWVCEAIKSGDFQLAFLAPGIVGSSPITGE